MKAVMINWIGALVAVAGILVSPHGQAWAQSSWSILKYDENGRPVSVEGGSGRGEDKEAAGRDEKTGQPKKLITAGEILIAEPEPGMIHTLTRRGYRVVEEYSLPFLRMEMVKLRMPPDVSVLEALDKLQREFPKSHIDTNDILDPTAGPRTQLAQNENYARTVVGWGEVPRSCGRGMVLGMIDGAVDRRHPLLVGQDLEYRSFIKEGRRAAKQDHGTAIAAMLIGNPEAGEGGLLPGAKLYAANIFEKRGRGPTGNLAAMIRAVDWLGQSGVKVVNLSIAGGENNLMRLVVNRAVKAGLMMVAAAGNKGPGAPPVWPAAHRESLAVTAIDQKLRPYQYANVGSYIDFAAPGVNIRVHTPHGDKVESGTSMATPFITAVVALHIHLGYNASPDSLRANLQRLSRDLGQKGRDQQFGWGLVRVRPKCQ